MPHINDLVNDAIQELKERAAQESIDLADLIHEVADSQVPIFNYELLEVGQSNLRLAVTEPEL